MLVNFESLENSSRVWIYQSNRAFSESEVIEIKDKTEEFIEDWLGHGDQIKASFQIKYNQFIMIAVDQNYNEVSGCSIDASVNFIKDIEKEFQLDLTNKLNISFKHKENINIVSMANFQKYAKQHKITSKTVVFNNMVSTIGDLSENWEVTADKSWHKRFLAQ
ncbi:MAG: ABC transporter ATPase [Lutibacter sp.]|uniref:ABC transporter ATPase n=1 Tax=Lutibacter sp. TaxID=1925666 RepID=UPI00385A1765